MSTEATIDYISTNPLLNWVSVNLKCDYCGDEIKYHRNAMAVWLDTYPHIVYYAHKDRCLDRVEKILRNGLCMTDELEDHFYDVLASMGFTQADNKIVLKSRLLSNEQD